MVKKFLTGSKRTTDKAGRFWAWVIKVRPKGSTRWFLEAKFESKRKAQKWARMLKKEDPKIAQIKIVKERFIGY